MSIEETLIQKAKEVAKPVTLSTKASAGNVGAALITEAGNIYTGICIDTCCSMGFCAEHNAIGSMLTQGEKNIVTIVAVNSEGKIYAPCGRCREFISQISEYNLNTKVLLDGGRTSSIAQLLPELW